MSKKLEKTGGLRLLINKVEICYVNKIIHSLKQDKLLINLWIMWISGKKGSKIRGQKSG